MEINGFRLTEAGRGGMAVVYKGDNGFCKKAFKMVRPDQQDVNKSALLTQKFLQEIQMMAKLGQHPNVVQLQNAYPYTVNGKPVTVLEMEWVEGLDLEKYVSQRHPHGLPAQEVKKIALQVLDGMAHAHRQNILHLDIKPSNIMRGPQGHVKIIDFGIAKVVGENASIVDGGRKKAVTSTETGGTTFKGTLAFASPEQLVGGKLTPASDIYSFGRTLQYLCTGSTEPSAEIQDDRLAAIVKVCTFMKPQERFSSCRRVKEALLMPPPKPRKTCRHCGHEVGVNDKFCPNCGKSMSDEVKAEKCPRCGTERRPDSPYCGQCGYNFNAPEPKPDPVPPTPPRVLGYECQVCHKYIKRPKDGILRFCIYCSAPETKLSPIYENRN